MEQVKSVTTGVSLPGRSNVAPILAISWDQNKVRISPPEVQQQLSAGDPRIELFARSDGVSIMPYMMEKREDEIVAQRLGEVLSAAVQ